MGKFKRIRGIAYTTKCSQQLAMSAIDKVRNIFNNFIPDVYIYTDHYKGKDAGNSAGYAVSLIAETTESILISSEYCYEYKSKENDPNKIGEIASKLLLEEIDKGGCIDTLHQHICLLLMILTPEDISQIRLGKLSIQTIECLRLYKEFFGITFHIQPQPDQTLLLSCRGIGYKNIARKSKKKKKKKINFYFFLLIFI